MQKSSRQMMIRYFPEEFEFGRENDFPLKIVKGQKLSKKHMNQLLMIGKKMKKVLMTPIKTIF